MKKIFYKLIGVLVAAAALSAVAVTPVAATTANAPAEGGEPVASANAAANTGWTTVESAPITHTMKVTVALVAPRGTTPSFDKAAAQRSINAANTFLSRETDGRVTIQTEQISDWMFPPDDAPCSWNGVWQHYAQQQLGWQRAPGRHLVVMVPPGPPCPGWANGEQNWGLTAGGLTFQGGADPYLVMHELGHNMSMFHATSMGCDGGWDFSTLGAGIPERCWRTEYGNRLDLMGGAWTFNPYASPTLSRIGQLPRRYEPTCGAVRSMNVTSVGAGSNAREAISFADPRDPGARYWVDFRAQNDANIYNALHGTRNAFKPSRDGVQVMRNDPNQWSGHTVLSRPYDGDNHRQLSNLNERIVLGGGAWVEWKGKTVDGEAIIEVFLPCRAFETQMIAQHSQLCMDNLNWSSVDGNQQAQWTCGNAAVQRYAFIEVPGATDVFTITNRHSGKCLEVASGSSSNGAAVQQSVCNGSASQQFTTRKVTYPNANSKDYQLVARHSGKCVDVEEASLTAGAKMIQWNCAAPSGVQAGNQVFRLAGRP